MCLTNVPLSITYDEFGELTNRLDQIKKRWITVDSNARKLFNQQLDDIIYDMDSHIAVHNRFDVSIPETDPDSIALRTQESTPNAHGDNDESHYCYPGDDQDDFIFHVV